MPPATKTTAKKAAAPVPSSDHEQQPEESTSASQQHGLGRRLRVGQLATYRYKDPYLGGPEGPAEVAMVGVVVHVDDEGAAQLALLDRVTGHLPAADLEAH